jgi:two-component system chemotaxis sensor kinase CheA
MDQARYTALFLAESREHLGACNRLLLEWERDPSAREPVDGLFRAIHTVKGMAGTMGYGRLADLAHRAEHLLDSLRSGRVVATAGTVDLLLRAVDQLERGVEIAAADGDAQPAGTSKHPDRRRRIASRGRAWWERRKAGPAPAVEPPVGDRPGRPVECGPAPSCEGRAPIWRYAAPRRLGRTGVVPPPAAFEGDAFDGRFSFRLESEASDAEIVETIRAAGEIDAVTIGADVMTTAEWQVPSAATGGVAARVEAAARSGQVRVDRRRLDALMNQVGELVVARNRLLELAQAEPGGELEALGTRISRLVSDLQSEIIQARMTPVWQVFDRFPRAVRDLARQLGKQVRFEMEGEGIELDRAILDEIGDPLLHVLRNAVDHGIESPEERVAAGKPAEGRVTLSAARERSSVAIRISDDGRGIDRTAILAKAKREGAAAADLETVSDDMLLKIIARPGFTTAGQLSSVSGRGVGIDVVLTRVRAHGGTVEIATEPGQGTTFTLRLPITLAILRALLTRVGGERYLLPLSYVAETVEYDTQPVTAVQGREALVLRDQVIPTVHSGAARRGAERVAAAPAGARDRSRRPPFRRRGGRPAGPAGSGGGAVRGPPRDPAALQRRDHPRRRLPGADTRRCSPSVKGTSMEDVRDLKELQFDALKEVANIGAGHAATALSQMTHKKIMITVPEVTVTALEDTAEVLGRPDQVVAAVLMHMMGDLTGRTLLLFPEPAARSLCDILLRRASGATTEFGEMEQSGIKEVGNILSSAYLNALSDFMGMMLVPSVPSLVVDQSAAVLTSTYLNFGTERDYVFCVETAFQFEGGPSDQLMGHFLLLPDLASLRAIFDAIRLG